MHTGSIQDGYRIKRGFARVFGMVSPYALPLSHWERGVDSLPLLVGEGG